MSDMPASHRQVQFGHAIRFAQRGTLLGILEVDHETRAHYAFSWGLTAGTYTAMVWDSLVRQGFAAVTEGPCPT